MNGMFLKIIGFSFLLIFNIVGTLMNLSNTLDGKVDIVTGIIFTVLSLGAACIFGVYLRISITNFKKERDENRNH